MDFFSEEIIAIAQKAYEEATAITWRQAEVGRTLTQNDKIALVDDKTLVIGVDIGSEKLILDHLPEYSCHLVAVHLNEGCLHLNLCHLSLPL